MTIGIFWPTWIFASSLSKVSSVGVDRMLAVASRLQRPDQRSDVENLLPGDGDGATEKTEAQALTDRCRIASDLPDVRAGASC